MKIYDSIIFDLDGTLWNSSETVAEAWNTALAEGGHSLKITGADVLSHMGKSMDVIMRDVFGADISDEAVAEFLDMLSVLEQQVKQSTLFNTLFPLAGMLVP